MYHFQWEPCIIKEHTVTCYEVQTLQCCPIPFASPIVESADDWLCCSEALINFLAMDELLLSPDKAWKLNLVLQRLYLMGAPKVGLRVPLNV